MVSAGRYERQEKIDVPTEKATVIGDLLRGAYYGLVSEILDAGLASVADLDLAVSQALAIQPPFSTMNEIGIGMRHFLDTAPFDPN